MAQTHDATMATNVKMPFNDKLKLLGKLKGSIHFEKILTASSAYSDNLHGPSTLALPSRFVQEHGDKFRKYVILRTELSTKAWSVSLTVFHKSPTVRQVKFAGGWKPFATFHSLMVGDSLIFSLTAISEFEVYMFPGNGSPKKLPSQLASKMWSNDFGLPRKKAKQYSYACKSEPILSAEVDIEGAVKLNERILQRRTIGEQRAVLAFGHISASNRNSSYSKSCKSKNLMDLSFGGNHHDSNKGHEPELVHDELIVPSATGGRKNLGNEYIQGPTIRKKWNELMVQKKATGEQRVVYALGHNPTSLRNSFNSKDVHLLDSKSVIDSPSRHHHDSNNGQEHALDHDDLMVQSGVTGDVPAQHAGGKKDAGDENQGFPEEFTLQKIPMNFPLSAGFLKQLSVSNLDYRYEGAERGGRTACMEIPVVFWRTYGSRLHSLVKLQGIREDSQVLIVACLPILQGDQTWRLYLRNGWRNFAEANSLDVGQVLEFTLTADSFFVVRRANF